MAERAPACSYDIDDIIKRRGPCRVMVVVINTDYARSTYI